MPEMTRNPKVKSNRRWIWLYALGVALILAAQTAARDQQAADTTIICPADEITDTVLFGDIKDPNKRFYLPRYRVAVQTVSGDSQYRVRVYKQGAGAVMEIYLEKYAAPELGDAARTAQELPHQIKAMLRYTSDNAAAAQPSPFREFVFQETSVAGTGVKAVLRLENLQDRDSLLRALKDPKLSPVLLVARTLTARRRPKDQIQALEREVSDKRFSYTHAGRAGVVVPRETWDALYELERYLQELKNIGVPVTVTLENIDPRRPFSFDGPLHSYVFAGLNSGSEAVAQLVREQVSWRDRYYSYFRPADRSDRWYYLPDRFVLARQDQLPKISVRFTGPPESQSVDLEYIAVPFTDPGRLEAARAALALGTSDSVTLEPLVAKDATLWVALPGFDAEGPFQRRAGASVDLRDGLKDQVRLSLDGFQKIYAALFNQSHTLFTGEVRLNPDGVTQERVPFEARVIDLSPEAFWDKAISQQVFADYQRTIKVKTTASVFAKEVKALIVLFRGGDDEVELHEDKLEGEVGVRTPMRDYILNSGGGGEYYYKVTTVREQNGKILTTKMPSWKTSGDSILYPEVP
jgi:hypothetical protein